MATTATSAELETEFDRIAALTPAASRLTAAERWILENLPLRRGAVLDIGCGVGDLARQLAGRFRATHAIDLSAGMITEARRRTPPALPIAYERAGMFEWLDRSPAAYDCIVSVATLHHVDLTAALARMAGALAPGGRLLVVDLYDRRGLRHLLTNAIAFAVNVAAEAMALARGESSWRFRRAYRAHGRKETYLTFEEIEKCVHTTLPGAHVSGTLRWRYRLLWEKPLGR